MFRRFYGFLVIIIVVVLLILNVRLYADIGIDDTLINRREKLNRLNFLTDELHDNAGREMQQLFPEGFVFINALYGLSWIEYSRNYVLSDSLNAKALIEARWALSEIESPAGTLPFSEDLAPKYGIFYAGWHNWLEGSIFLIQDPTDYDSSAVYKFKQNCRRVADALENSETPYLQSYYSGRWPADVFVAVAGLKLHDTLFEPQFANVYQNWISKVKNNLDPTTKLIPHSANYPFSPRGSSQALILRFLLEIDPEFAHEQYQIYQDLFEVSLLGLPAIREYPKGSITNGNDIDSGPVWFDIGSVATIVGSGTKRSFNDSDYIPIRQTIEAVSLNINLGRRKSYLGGVLPMIDAFQLWTDIATPITANNVNQNYSTQTDWWWRLPTHGISLIIILMLAFPLFKTGKRDS